MDREFLDNYWKYYLLLESNFMDTFRYVEPDEHNFNVFSNEYIKQYQTICSEIDVVCKYFCNIINPEVNCNNIVEYANIIIRNISNMKHERVSIKRYRLNDLYPWKEWQLEDNTNKYKSPNWWSRYNKVKHNRNNNITVANLENVLNALAGLYVLEVYCYEKIKNGEGIVYPTPRSELFTLNDFHDGTINHRKLYELDEV